MVGDGVPFASLSEETTRWIPSARSHTERWRTRGVYARRAAMADGCNLNLRTAAAQ